MNMMLFMSVLTQRSILGQRDQSLLAYPAFAYVILSSFDRFLANHKRALQ